MLSCKANAQQEVLLLSQILSLIQGTSAAGKEQIQGAEPKWRAALHGSLAELPEC